MSQTTTPHQAPRDIDHNDAIRAPYLTIDELRDKAKALASEVSGTLPGFFDFEFFARHKENEREILRVYRTTAVDVEAGATITPAAEWLLDNHYIIEEAIQEVRRDFPRRFYKQLVMTKVGDRIIPRVLALAWLYVAHTHSTVTRDGLTALAEGYQSETPLQIGELWALPSMVRYVLVENLRRISTRVEQSRQMRRKANAAADEVIRLTDEAACRDYLATLEPLADDNTFATQFLYRLRNGSQTSALAVEWLEKRLELNGRTPEEAMAAEHNRLSSGNVTMGSIIKGLRTIDDTEWSVWVEEVSHVDKILRTHSDYEALDFGSRNSYRTTIEKLAQRSEKTELDIAQTAVDLAVSAATESGGDSDAPSNVGSFLAGDRRQELERAVGYRVPIHTALTRAFKRLHWLAIALPVLALTALALALVAWYLSYAGLSLPLIVVLVALFALPASEGATGLFNTLATYMMKPARLVGYEFKEGIPAQARTLVAVPCLISKRDHVDELVRNLEVHYLTNPRGEVYFALLSDWPDAKTEESEADLEVLEYAKREIAALNTRYRDAGRTPFYLLHRRRLFNPQEDCWMGWERKRGKLHELNLLLRGDKDTSYLPGANTVPEGVQYVMTLDADTRLMRDAVTKLVGKMYHPINRSVHDAKTGRVISGYGILQPRVTPSLTTGKDASVFQRVFSTNRGLDPYVFTVSDVYQDITGEGSFTGKGLYHVDAFETAIKGRIDENTILSHDLLEGSFARCALVTDVELVEDFPIRYEVEISRQHRWARGDWQLIPYILDPGRGITALGRWKMVDNLRRSLTPIAWFAASIIGWFAMDPLDTLIWQLLLIFSLFVAPTISLINALVPRQTDIVPAAHFQSLLNDMKGANAQVALRIVFIADMACMMADAIIRSIYRMTVSRKLLLEWRTAASIQSVAQGSILTYYKTMRYAPVLAIAAFALAWGEAGYSALVGLPFTLMWALSPLVAWYVSQSAETEDRLEVPDETKVELRRIARRTWRYYETFANAGEHYLPPDNFQETPEPIVARRTSPTNIGVFLLSIVSARHFGWLSFEQTIEKLEQTIGTVERMDKFRGHLFNWYHTDTLKPLGNRYISAVDSGNLAGHLIAVSSACRHWAEAPSAYLQGNLDGIGDVGGILLEALKDLPDDRKIVRPLRTRLMERITGFLNALETVKREHEFASIQVADLTVLSRDIQKLAANLHHELRSDNSTDVLRWSESLVAVCEAHKADSGFDLSDIEPLRLRLASLRDRARSLAFSMDFAFLFRKERRLLSIGYRVETLELDEACYDLLASEARLTSLFAIAKGDLPTEHWYKLGRQVVPIGSRAALVSWSGSMFEYLMPPLVMQERQGGILNQTNNLIVKEQMNHGKRLNIPWGISEAAFNARDHVLAYQYTNFGVPTLGLKRGLGQNAVIAPYASILASQYDPEAAADNLRKLRALGALGQYGFHDAVDFTPTRVPKGKTCAVVYNYYAHHHGMSIAAIANVTFNGLLRELFHADPVIEAAELLLQEKAPREIPVMSGKYEPSTPGKGQADLLRPEIRMISEPLAKDRELVLLSNGHYSVMLTATGTGFSRWNGLTVARFKPDPTEDRSGTFIFLRDTASGEWWSATAAPRRAAEEKSRVVFSDDKAEFTKTVGTLTSTVECVVATEHDAEGRRVTLLNTGTEDRFIEVTSYMEPVLSSDDSDIAHPAFSRMFIKTELGRRGDVIRVERKKRSPSDPDICVAHLVSDDSGQSRTTEFETDRYRFIGRGRTLSEAAAFDPGATLSGTQGYTLDPIASLRRSVRVPAGKKVTLVYWTIAAPSRQEVDAAIERYRHADAFNHEMLHAWTRTQVEMRHIGITSQQAAAFQHLGRYLIYPDMHLRADPETVRAGLASQSTLWPNSISGDYPIFALRINDEMDAEVVKEALSAQDYLMRHGVVTDLVILNERAASYAQDMQHALEQLAESMRSKQAEGGQSHVFTVRRDLMDESGWNAVLAAARVVFHAKNGKITDQVKHAIELFAATRGADAVDTDWYPPVPVMAGRETRPEIVVDGSDLDFWNGYGGFSADGSEYVVRLSPGQATPHPWINVIANDTFGFHVSAEGAGFSWSTNSRDYQLTPWSNDPVANRSGETFYVADLESGEVVSPIASASHRDDAAFEARHGIGYSRFSTEAVGLKLELAMTVDQAEPVRYTALTIRNTGDTPRRLRSYGYVEWLLGINPIRTTPFILTSRDEESGALFASNPYSIDYSGRVAFFTAIEPMSGFASSRREFIGRHGSLKMPQAVFKASPLSGSIDPEGDACSALAVDIELQPGEEKTITFLMGDAETADQARSVLAKAKAKGFATALDEAKRFWGDVTGRIKVKTGDKSFDNLVNHWLPYQTLGCRIKARVAFYQASGAYGFRDQLQDSLAFLTTEPALARRQILTAASRQFKEGDVQHWWLPKTGAGIRSTISDDVVWLAYAIHAYIEATGEAALLDDEVAFLDGPTLAIGRHDAFFKPEVSTEKASLYEHAARALDLAVSRTGTNGLPLILGGDWNDGMNRVGVAGRGESVWLGWFLAHGLTVFAPYAEARGDQARAERWRERLKSLKAALEKAGWDGEHYRRGYFDEGDPLGSDLSDECKIDAIAQSWSVLSGFGDPERQQKAMDAVMKRLVDEENGIVRLFTPAFENSRFDPGYIGSYPPGVRENGGQYTHAAIWTGLAFAKLGRTEEAWKVFSMLNPVHHAESREEAERYRVEPYIVTADVYGGPGYEGRGGWSWYTGSGGWLYRFALEGILGIHRQGEALALRPNLPEKLDRYEAEVTISGKTVALDVSRKADGSGYEVTADGKAVAASGDSFVVTLG
ncbi:protein ndvB [Allorhizobium sp. BGMRC 0089]|uniref:GH36-type glycosyl hydrolase domain-containing protein n=1 Tax=Allorhizobium sonneratiae TaxID=2934936 RepID=UPI00203466B5|nr:glucoamylase family protein [Allorhizobium sonneratiae]MCM2293314.1 protein ndvB [Allorhizobium sonneratiae]